MFFDIQSMQITDVTTFYNNTITNRYIEFYDNKMVKISDIQYKGIKDMLSNIGGYATSISVPLILIFKSVIQKRWEKSLVRNLSTDKDKTYEQKLNKVKRRVSFKSIYELHDRIQL